MSRYIAAPRDRAGRGMREGGNAMRGSAVRALGAIALAALLAPLSVALGSNAGRDYPRCIQACNATRKACDTRCSDDCFALYPGTPNRALRDACIASCKSLCGTQSDDCKDVCRGTEPPTGEEP